MFCKNCGNEVAPGTAYCPKCGQAIDWNQAQGANGYGYAQQPQPGMNNGYGYAQQPQPQPQPVYVAPQAKKSKLAAGLLGIFLGSLGVHNFYLGYNGKAVAQLLISLLTCGVGAVVSGIWGLIEGIMILIGSISVDANGVPLGD